MLCVTNRFILGLCVQEPADGEEAAEGGAAEEEEDYSMSPEDLERRLGALRESTTFTVFDFTRRGLFDRDKLIVTCLLTLQVTYLTVLAYGLCNQRKTL